ncbi:NAD-dependent epimerase/dehydratase family protein [Candidatus Pelagibacter sp. HIMB1542]|uniref:NAD-dependent epimerase/dehydratase family protein n=1 Tax=Candidatus Pelagibacter sp. HIMB1542 TaxID=3413346 RepID=UPI003F83DEA5
MKNLIIVTGGAGFVGSNLIEFLVAKTNYEIISLDNYSTGSKKNHIKHNKVKYIKGNTLNINNILEKYKKKINSIFHFGEFARIFQSFKKFDECYQSNTIGSKAVFKFCLDNNIKLIYSATSASLGNKENDKNLSPYAFTKSRNIDLLENLKKWFNLKFEIIFFYNVYGPRQIKVGDMATVIGIFEDQYKKKKPLTVVKPGSQTRRFTHIDDTVQICYEAFKAGKCRYYSISNKNYYSIIEVAKMFKSQIKFLKPRLGERYASALTKISSNNKIIQKYGKLQLKDYISSFIKSHNYEN